MEGYNIYRSDVEFAASSQAEKLHAALFKGKYYIDLTPEDGLWYYRVTSETEAGNESPPSELASAESDSVMPCAVSISYAPSGPCEPETGRTGIGRVELVLAASEPLAAIPFLSVTPENGLPILVDLKMESETLFSGAFDIEETTKSGVCMGRVFRKGPGRQPGKPNRLWRNASDRYLKARA